MGTRSALLRKVSRDGPADGRLYRLRPERGPEAVSRGAAFNGVAHNRTKVLPPLPCDSLRPALRIRGPEFGVGRPGRGGGSRRAACGTHPYSVHFEYGRANDRESRKSWATEEWVAECLLCDLEWEGHSP